MSTFLVLYLIRKVCLFRKGVRTFTPLIALATKFFTKFLVSIRKKLTKTLFTLTFSDIEENLKSKSFENVPKMQYVCYSESAKDVVKNSTKSVEIYNFILKVRFDKMR